MKKLIKKIIVFVCVLTISTIPVSTALAASGGTATLVHNANGLTVYRFLPDYTILYSGENIGLINGSSLWQIPAGKSWTFSCDIVPTLGYFNVQVVRMGVGIIYQNNLNDDFTFNFASEITDYNYLIIITALDRTLIDGYSVQIH